MRDGLIVLVGASEGANEKTGGKYMYSLEERRMLSDWDINIVDTVSVKIDPTFTKYVDTDLEERNNLFNVKRLIHLYNLDGIYNDDFYHGSIQSYIKSKQFQKECLNQYKRIVIISYTCEIDNLLTELNKQYDFPVFNFGLIPNKLNIDMLRNSLLDYDKLMVQRAVRVMVDKIMYKLCLHSNEHTKKSSWNNTDKADLEDYNNSVGIILLTMCNSLSRLNLAYVRYAAVHLNRVGDAIFGKLADPKNPAKTMDKIEHNVCDFKVYKYIPVKNTRAEMWKR